MHISGRDVGEKDFIIQKQENGLGELLQGDEEKKEFNTTVVTVAMYLHKFIWKDQTEKQMYRVNPMILVEDMKPFFKKLDIKVKDLTGDEVNEYYAHLREKGLKGTTCQRHHSLLHLAFKSAMKRRVIPSNPVDQADRPKA